MGSAKVLSLGMLAGLSEQGTLQLFGRFYRKVSLERRRGRGGEGEAARERRRERGGEGETAGGGRRGRGGE